jgi:hypothetical protein
MVLMVVDREWRVAGAATSSLLAKLSCSQLVLGTCM